MLLGNGFLPMFAGGAGKQIWDFAAGMPSGASILRSGGNATYFDATGVMQVASGGNTERRNYDPATLTFEGLYVERAATNLTTYAEQFNDVTWSKIASAVSADATTAPIGSVTADKLTPNSGAVSNCYAQKSYTVINATQYTNTFFAKSAGYRYAGTFGSNFLGVVVFDLNTGVVATGSGSITAINSGWYRCHASTVVTSTSINARCYSSNSSSLGTFTSNGSDGTFLWGAQLESGVATSYIPTTSTAVTRNAESLVLQSVGASSLRVTFDDNSTQDISVTPGTVTLTAAALNRSLVRKVEEL